MKKFIILGLTLFVFYNSFGQWFVIKNINGFVNVRDVKSKIIGTLPSGKCLFSYYIIKGNWFPVEISRHGQTRVGYINKSMIRPIDSFEKFKIKKINDSSEELTLDSVSITFNVGKFYREDHVVEIEEDPHGIEYISSIDSGKKYYGEYAAMPVKEYKSFIIRSGNSESYVEKKYYDDIYEPNLYNTEAYLDKRENKIYIISYNRDAPRAYYVLWQISNGKVVHREIESDF